MISQRAQHEALHSIEVELDQAEPHLRELQARVMQLRRAAASLRSLLDLPSREVPRRATAHAGEWSETSAAEGPFQGVSNGRGSTVDPSSTDRVIEILREKASETTRSEIAREFKLRGWDLEWKEPEAALRMAIRRANEREGVVAVRPGAYVFMPALDETERAALQRRLAERLMRREAQSRPNRIHARQATSSQAAEMTTRPVGNPGEGAGKD